MRESKRDPLGQTIQSMLFFGANPRLNCVLRPKVCHRAGFPKRQLRTALVMLNPTREENIM